MTSSLRGAQGWARATSTTLCSGTTMARESLMQSCLSCKSSTSSARWPVCEAGRRTAPPPQVLQVSDLAVRWRRCLWAVRPCELGSVCGVWRTAGSRAVGCAQCAVACRLRLMMGMGGFNLHQGTNIPRGRVLGPKAWGSSRGARGPRCDKP